MQGTALPKRLLLALLCLAATASARPEHVGGVAGSGGVNAARHLEAPYLVLVSIDGFRWDFPDLHDMPAIRRLAREGVCAERLVPAFPTLTFPNHYTIVTGLYPAHHGITANEFPVGGGQWYRPRLREMVEDGRWYRGEPLWVTAEKQGMVSASFFWVGSEAEIQGIRPTHWQRFNKDIAGNERVDQVLAWLAEPESTRPHLYTLYFEDVDDQSHLYGLASEETAEAAWRVDTWIQQLLDGLEALPHGDRVNVVVVSDHGQADYLPDRETLRIDRLVGLDGVASAEGGSYVFLHLDRPDPARAAALRDAINDAWAHGRAWLREEAPAGWRVTGDPRFPDVIVVADPGYQVTAGDDANHGGTIGDHGWAPEAPDMHGIFIAWGPAFRAGLRTGPVRSVDIHPLLLTLLGLPAPGGTDGDPAALAGILR